MLYDPLLEKQGYTYPSGPGRKVSAVAKTCPPSRPPVCTAWVIAAENAPHSIWTTFTVTLRVRRDCWIKRARHEFGVVGRTADLDRESAIWIARLGEQPLRAVDVRRVEGKRPRIERPVGEAGVDGAGQHAAAEDRLVDRSEE